MTQPDLAWPRRTRELHNHHLHGNEDRHGALNESPGLVGAKLEKPRGRRWWLARGE